MFRYVIVCLLAGFLWSVTAQDEPVVQLKQLAPYTYICVEMTGDFVQHETAFSSLYEQTGIQGIILNDYPFGIYHNSPENTPVDSLVWEIGSAVTGIDSVKAPLVLKTWPHTTVASLIYEGPFDDSMAAQYGILNAWIMQNGYQVTGPLQEIFLTMPSQNAEGQYSGQVEIVMPVTK